MKELQKKRSHISQRSKLFLTLSVMWALGSISSDAVIYSSGSTNQDWLNASNWGGTDPATNTNEIFVIQSGHILGPIDGSSAAQTWPATRLMVDAGGTLNLDQGDADFQQSENGLQLSGGTISITATAVNTEASILGNIEISAPSSIAMDANELALVKGILIGHADLDLTRSINTADSGNGFPALILRSKMFDFSGDITTSSWSGWGRFIVQNGNWGTGDLTFNPAGGGVLRPGAAFNAHGRLLVPDSSAKVDVKSRTNIFAPGSAFGGEELTDTYNWVNDNTDAFTDVPSALGTVDLTPFLLNTDRAVLCIANSIINLSVDVNNLFDLDEPMSLKNMAALFEQVVDVDAYQEALSDPNDLPYPLEYWKWDEPYAKIHSILILYEQTRDVALLEPACMVADNIIAYAESNPNEMPLESNPLEVTKFMAPTIAARIIFEHAIVHPTEVSSEQLTKAKEYLDWSLYLYNRFAVQDQNATTRLKKTDTWNGLYAEGNRTLTRPWNRQLWLTLPCAIAREAIAAYLILNPSDTSYLHDDENYARMINASATLFDWNADFRSHGDHDYAYWCYGTERNYAVPKIKTEGWVDATYEGRVYHHLNEDTPHAGPDLYAFYSFAKRSGKHPEYAPFQNIAKRTLNSVVDHSAKRANPPSSSEDPRKGPLFYIMPPDREQVGLTPRTKTVWIPATFPMSCADYYPEIYRIALSAQVRQGALDLSRLCFLISGKISYLEASKGIPAAPSLVTYQSANGSLDWPLSPEPDVTGYHVYHSSTAGGPYLRVATDVSVTEHTATNAGFYVVTAVDSLGNESAYSEEATIFARPNAPTGLAGHNRNDGMELTWTASTSSNVVSYTIYRSHGGSTPFYPIRTGVTEPRWVDTTPYVADIQVTPPHYKIKAVNANYVESDFSQELIPVQNNFVTYDDLLFCNSGSVTADITANDVVVQWGSLVDISSVGDAVVSTNGTQVEGVNMGGATVTVNGETFSNKEPFISTLFGKSFDDKIYAGGNVSESFESMLDTLRWLDLRPASVYMDSMEAGKTYELQLLVSDYRGALLMNEERQFSLYGIKSPSIYDRNASLTCTFTANREILNLELSQKGSNPVVSLCGYQIREVDPIQQLVLNSFTPAAHGTVTQNGNLVTYTPNPGFTGTDSFTYQVTETNSGEIGTATVKVIVSDPTQLDFGNIPPKVIINATPRIGDDPLEVTVDASSSTDDGTIVLYEWDLDDDGEIDATGPTAVFTYPETGQYPISLRVTDDEGQQVVKTISVFAGNPLAPKLWYKFDELSGSTAIDSSGNGFDGTLNQEGAWISSGQYNGALDFNGNTKITVPDGAFSTVENELSISFWVHDQGRTFTNARLFSANSSQGTWRSNFTWGTYEVKFEFAGDYARYDTEDFSTIGSNWTHWVVVKHVPTKRMQIYRNGVCEIDWSGRDKTLENATGFILGTSGSDYFQGALDDFRIYSHALSPVEVAAIYNHTELSEGYGVWGKAYQLQSPNDGEFDDADLDGLLNIVEYALNLDPTIQNVERSLPALALAPDHSYIDVTYRESTTAVSIGDASVALVASTNLMSASWQDLPGDPISSTLIDNGMTRLITKRVYIDDMQKHFFKLHVTKPE